MDCTRTTIQFRKVSDIGNQEGKNSCVFIAEDLQLGGNLVIKQMEKTKFKPADYFSEAKMIFDCKHSNVAEIQYASEDDDYIYLAMPYYKNGSLNTLCTCRFLTVREIIKYSLDILSALNLIHSKKSLHLDIKPTNILIDDTGKAILTDFGLSKHMDLNGVAEQPNNYTHHIDPEWYSSSARTIQSDIYQVGLTIYRFCNGIDILKHQIAQLRISNKQELGQQILKGNFPVRDYFLPHVPQKLRRIVRRSIAIDPDKRYKTAIEMMNDLSIINSSLDWQFANDWHLPYTMTNDKYRYEIEVEDGRISCVRTNIKTEKSAKVTKHCCTYSSRKDLLRKLSSIIECIS